MSRNSRPSIDGFVLKRRNNEQRPRLGVDTTPVPERFLSRPQPDGHAPRHQQKHPELLNRKNTPVNLGAQEPEPKREKKPHSMGLRRDDIDAALNELSEKDTKKQRRSFSFKKLFKRTLLALGIVLVLIGGFVLIKAFLAGGRVFDGNLFAALLNDGKPLKVDEYGRSNILLFGTSEDDPGHDGAELTDSIMIVSIHAKNKDSFMVSVPRDLWVKYGQACSSGYEGKINVVYSCGKEDGGQKGGAEMLKDTVSKTFGIDIQYYSQVNYTALKQAVDSVGGVTVEIKSDDPRGILDRNFDWKCRYQCYYVKWPNGPAKLSGEQALALARARNAAGGYGLGGGNFDREQYQQKILVALREKAMSAGVLANPIAVNGLLDSLGDNVRTNFEASEVKTLVKLAQDIDAAKMRSLNLVDEKKPIMTTGSFSGQSIVRPVAGVYDFSELKAFIAANLNGDVGVLEEATIDVLNGSGVPGAAQKQADELEEAGYTIGVVDNSPVTASGVKIYDLSAGKMPSTKSKLEKHFGVSATKTLPEGVTSTANFVIIIGTNGAD